MKNIKRLLFVGVSILNLLFVTPGCISAEASRAQGDEQTLWSLEHSYWRYVQNNDLAAYVDLWHPNFLGWPAVSSAPVTKDHITDWITSQASKGLAFKTGEFKPAAIHVTGDIASVCYWITYQLVGKDGSGPTYTVRITHAWIRAGSDWHIISGMSMPEPESAAK